MYVWPKQLSHPLFSVFCPVFVCASVIYHHTMAGTGNRRKHLYEFNTHTMKKPKREPTYPQPFHSLGSIKGDKHSASRYYIGVILLCYIQQYCV